MICELDLILVGFLMVSGRVQVVFFSSHVRVVFFLVFLGFDLKVDKLISVGRLPSI